MATLVSAIVPSSAGARGPGATRPHQARVVTASQAAAEPPSAPVERHHRARVERRGEMRARRVREVALDEAGSQPSLVMEPLSEGASAGS